MAEIHKKESANKRKTYEEGFIGFAWKIAENGEIILPDTPLPKTPKEKARPGPNAATQIISEEYFECEGTWKKTLQKRSTGDHVDPYIYPPEGKKLRSGNDMIDFIVKHPHYWKSFDPITINFERSKGAKMSAAGRKLVKFLELVRNGVDKDEALESCQHLPKEKRTPSRIPCKLCKGDYYFCIGFANFTSPTGIFICYVVACCKSFL